MYEEEEPMYEEPPSLPPRSDDFLEEETPMLPHRPAEVDEEEEEEDKGVYEELGELAPPAPPAGEKSRPTGRSHSFDLGNHFKVSLPADDDYEDLSRDQRAVAIYDYVGGERPFLPPVLLLLHVSVDRTFPPSDPPLPLPPQRLTTRSPSTRTTSSPTSR